MSAAGTAIQASGMRIVGAVAFVTAEQNESREPVAEPHVFEDARSEIDPAREIDPTRPAIRGELESVDRFPLGVPFGVSRIQGILREPNAIGCSKYLDEREGGRGSILKRRKQGTGGSSFIPFRIKPLDRHARLQQNRTARAFLAVATPVQRHAEEPREPSGLNPGRLGFKVPAKRLRPHINAEDRLELGTFRRVRRWRRRQNLLQQSSRVTIFQRLLQD